MECNFGREKCRFISATWEKASSGNKSSNPQKEKNQSGKMLLWWDTCCAEEFWENGGIWKILDMSANQSKMKNN
jgi:hypothetical protein